MSVCRNVVQTLLRASQDYRTAGGLKKSSERGHGIDPTGAE